MAKKADKKSSKVKAKAKAKSQEKTSLDTEVETLEMLVEQIKESGDENLIAWINEMLGSSLNFASKFEGTSNEDDDDDETEEDADDSDDGDDDDSDDDDDDDDDSDDGDDDDDADDEDDSDDDDDDDSDDDDSDDEDEDDEGLTNLKLPEIKKFITEEYGVDPKQFLGKTPPADKEKQRKKLIKAAEGLEAAYAKHQKKSLAALEKLADKNDIEYGKRGKEETRQDKLLRALVAAGVLTA